tara:strand:- start:637 stop:1515 length:879 start_codon:yes stop_codon:yes gene_type:complete
MQTIPESKKLILVTGTSGAGLSTALKILEDLGIKAVDNIPLALIDQLVALEVETAGRQLAVGLDARTSGFSAASVGRLAANLRDRLGKSCSIIFISAAKQDLMRRFNTTRRQHPLGEGLSLADAVTADLARMDEIASLADVHIDTSGSKPADMRRHLLDAFGVNDQRLTPVSVVSFSYRDGLPEGADIVLDMRFADNPHWIDDLREKTGQDAEIDEYLRQDEIAQSVLLDLKRMLTLMLGRMSAEGRPLITLAFGCTGGRHRSVWAAEAICKWLRVQGHDISLSHQNLDGEE